MLSRGRAVPPYTERPVTSWASIERHKTHKLGPFCDIIAAPFRPSHKRSIVSTLCRVVFFPLHLLGSPPRIHPRQPQPLPISPRLHADAFSPALCNPAGRCLLPLAGCVSQARTLRCYPFCICILASRDVCPLPSLSSSTSASRWRTRAPWTSSSTS